MRAHAEACICGPAACMRMQQAQKKKKKTLKTKRLTPNMLRNIKAI